ncbi:MAG TPA: hypothetical protein VGX70_04105 [Gemmataceae bacterium]|jgi:hypothetical protein|nr:hypothetical protein [Gemmataceae bacterium]
MENVQELLHQVRNYYLDHFHEVIKEKRRLPNSKLIVEPALRKKHDSKVGRQGQLNLPIRTDLVVRPTIHDSITVETEKALEFDSVMVDWTPNLKICLAPFRWEECRVWVDGLAGRTDWTPLIDWFEKWFDEFDLKAPLKKELQEVVHRLADPQVRGGVTMWVVDFGSAPITAFEEFLDALASLGAVSMQVGEEKKAEQDTSAKELHQAV